MVKKFKQIQISNLDESFKKFNLEPKPRSGWIRTIRTALSMPLSFPARKLGVSQQSIAKLEKSEAGETITLASLRKVAEAMGCELHYIIIPHKRSLKELIENRAEEKARIMVEDVNKTMALEDQAIIDSNNSIKLLKKELSENLNSKLWSLDEND